MNLNCLYFGKENHYLTLAMYFEENNHVIFAIHGARKLYCSFSW